ncbi:hypothetical protein ACCS51_28770 [Rhizobium ruizarguesonis]
MIPQASTLPDWVLILQALLTPAVAIAVAVIGFLQWRTAHQKVVLDLFDRRWKAAEAIIQSLKPILRDGRVRQSNDVLIIYNAMSDAQFLFGKDVNRLLARYRDVIGQIAVGSAYTNSPTNPHYQQGVDLLHDNMLRLIDFLGEFDAVCSRYMRMDQKLIRWPWTILLAWATALKRKIGI